MAVQGISLKQKIGLSHRPQRLYSNENNINSDRGDRVPSVPERRILCEYLLPPAALSS